MTTSDNDLFDLTVPESPGKGLYLKKYKIPRVNQIEKMEIDEFPASNSKNMETKPTAAYLHRRRGPTTSRTNPK